MLIMSKLDLEGTQQTILKLTSQRLSMPSVNQHFSTKQFVKHTNNQIYLENELTNLNVEQPVNHKLGAFKLVWK